MVDRFVLQRFLWLVVQNVDVLSELEIMLDCLSLDPTEFAGDAFLRMSNNVQSLILLKHERLELLVLPDISLFA